MMKIFIQYLIGTFMLLLVISSPVAAGGYYIGIQGGVGFLPETKAQDSEGSVNFSYDAGYDGSITLGYDIGNNYPNIGNGRIEVEFNAASNDINEVETIEGNVTVDGSADRASIMFNTIGEYVTESGMIIYALLGLGWAEISLDNVSILGEPFVDDSNSQLAYQAGVGVAWRFSDHFFVDLGYRYYGTTDPEFTKKDGGNLDYEYASHRLLAGLRLQF
jgi:opacity protein-like surface antigen